MPATKEPKKQSNPARNNASDETQPQEEPRFEPQPRDAKKGELVLVQYWAVVDRVDTSYGSSEVFVRDTERKEFPDKDDSKFAPFSIRGEVLFNGCMSAQQYGREEVITPSDLARKVLESKRIPFTVCFDTKTERQRVLQGRLRSGDGFRGYADVDELVQGKEDKPGYLEVKVEKDRIRQVDLRNLHWLIVDGVKYVSKYPPKKPKAEK